VISGDLTRQDTPVGQKPVGSDDLLGLLGRNIRIGSSVERNLEAPLQLYCSLFAGRKNSDGQYEGSFLVDNLESSGVGKFIIYGSVVRAQDSPWLMSWVNSSGSYVGSTGFVANMKYDSAAAASPPPFFPTMPTLRVLSWKEEPYR